jgi:hypothetical protein
MASEISPLRGILRSRFPTGINGAIGDDLTLIIKNFLDGVKIVIKGDPINSSWGITAPIVGRVRSFSFLTALKTVAFLS